MQYINKIFLIFIIIIATGCGNNNNKIAEEPEKILNNFKIQINLENKIKTLELLPKTIEMYKNGNGDLSDYTNSDKILLGINSRNDQNNYYATTDEIGNYVYQMFGPTTLEFKNINDNFIYDEINNIYYINNDITSSSVISYIDKITYKDNTYYATVYVGVKEDDGVYGDFDKDNLIHVLDYNDSDELERDKYMKFIYEFKTIAENTYVFSNLKRVYD